MRTPSQTPKRPPAIRPDRDRTPGRPQPGAATTEGLHVPPKAAPTSPSSPTSTRSEPPRAAQDPAQTPYKPQEARQRRPDDSQGRQGSRKAHSRPPALKRALFSGRPRVPIPQNQQKPAQRHPVRSRPHPGNPDRSARKSAPTRPSKPALTPPTTTNPGNSPAKAAASLPRRTGEPRQDQPPRTTASRAPPAAGRFSSSPTSPAAEKRARRRPSVPSCLDPRKRTSQTAAPPGQSRCSRTRAARPPRHLGGSRAPQPGPEPADSAGTVPCYSRWPVLNLRQTTKVPEASPLPPARSLTTM